MNFISCNFGLKSYLWFQIKQVRHACWFWNHLLDFKLNCTPLSSITITVYRIYFTPCIFNDWYGIGNFIFVIKLTFLFSNSGCVFLFCKGLILGMSAVKVWQIFFKKKTKQLCLDILFTLPQLHNHKVSSQDFHQM